MVHFSYQPWWCLQVWANTQMEFGEHKDTSLVRQAWAYMWDSHSHSLIRNPYRIPGSMGSLWEATTGSCSRNHTSSREKDGNNG